MKNLDEELFNQNNFEYIQYILSGSFRIEILLELYESEKNVKELKEILNKSESNILHYLKDFEEKTLVKREKDSYSLTSKGFLIIKHVIKLISNWETINSQLDFWDNHLYDKFPLSFILNMDLWDNSELVTYDNLDYNKASHVYSDLITKSKYIKVMLPVFSTYHLDALLSSVEKNDGILELITSKVILQNIYNSDLSKRFFKLKANGKLKVWVTDTALHINKFLTCTENFTSLYLIYDSGIYDDSVMLLNKEENSLNKMNELFDYYKKTVNRQ